MRVLQCFSDTFDCSAAWRGHDGIVLSSIVARQRQTDDYFLVTSGNDGAINVSVSWNLLAVRCNLSLVLGRAAWWPH